MDSAISLEAVVERLPVEAADAGIAVRAQQLAVEGDADLGVGVMPSISCSKSSLNYSAVP